MLALNIVNRSFLDLLNPLGFDQGAPIGFLLLQKAVTSLLGSSDYALRLVPLLAGLVSLPMMYSVSKRFSGQLAALLSLGLFALSPNLIYYSSELKQYSTDVMTALVLLLVFQKCLSSKTTPRAFVTLGVVGSLAIWISHPSLFVFAGIVLALGLTFALRRDSCRLSWLIGIGVAWGICFGIDYLVSLRHLESNTALIDYWSGSFAPLPPWNNSRWYYDSFIGMLRNPAKLPTTAIIVGSLIIGGLSYAFRRWQLSLAFLTTFLLTLLASALRKYPFSGRLLLFLVPLLFLLLAEGVERVRIILLRVNKPLAGLVSAALVAYVLYGPITVAYERLQSPPEGEHIKPVMAYVRENRLPTDLIYVYYAASPAFEFYAPLYGFDRDDYVVGVAARDDPHQYLQDIEKMRGNHRIWFAFSHNCSWCTVNEQEFILDHLNEIGLERDELLSSGSSVHLYDLGQMP